MAWIAVALTAALLIANVVFAQQPKPQATGPSEAAQWKAYATMLEVDVREKTRAAALCLATNDGIRAEIERLQKRIAELEKPKDKP